MTIAIEGEAGTGIEAKSAALADDLRRRAPCLIAYSGGVDSAYLAWIARRTLGREAVLALIADSASLPRAALRDALDFAATHDIGCETVATAELDDPRYRRNDAERCYFCKHELFERMSAERGRRGGFRSLLYGVNADDPLEVRPGHRAAAEHGVAAPLLDAGLGKAEIRALARAAGLEVWDRPAAACLASRVAYGIEVTPSRLGQIERAEAALLALGFRQLRVRCHDQLARVEIAPEELPRALDPEMARRMAAALRAAGFRYTTLDLEGYRTGAMNETLIQPTMP